MEAVGARKGNKAPTDQENLHKKLQEKRAFHSSLPRSAQWPFPRGKVTTREMSLWLVWGESGES